MDLGEIKKVGDEIKDVDVKIYTVDDVANMLKTSKMTIYRHIKSGRLKAGKAGKRYYVSSKALYNFLVRQGIL